MANQPDVPNDPKPEGAPPAPEKKPGEPAPKSPRVSSSEIDLGEQTLQTSVPKELQERANVKSKPRSDPDEDWSSVVPRQDEGTIELDSDDVVELDAPEDASILKGIDPSQLPSSAVRISAEELDEFTATSRELPRAPEESAGHEPDEFTSTARELPPPAVTPAADEADEAVPTARDLPRPEVLPVAEEPDESMTTARELPRAAEAQSILELEQVEESMTLAQQAPPFKAVPPLPPGLEPASEPTMNLGAAPPGQAGESEDEIDLGALSHEPEDSLAAEFAQLGRESQSPVPLGGSDSAVDLFEEQVLAEGTSDVQLGELPSPTGDRPSGIDVIAEEVESGVSLSSPAPQVADDDKESEEAAKTFRTDAAQAPEDSAVNLESVVPGGHEADFIDQDENLTYRDSIGVTDQATREEEVDLAARAAVPEAGEELAPHLEEEEEPALAQAKRRQPVAPGTVPTPGAPGSLRPWLGGGVLGAVVGGGVCAGVLWLAGALGGGANQVVPSVPSKPGPTVAEAAPTPVDLQALLATGRIDDAVQAAEKLPEDAAPEQLVHRGKARWLAYLKDQMLGRGKLDKNDEKVKQALNDLAKANTPEGRYWLGMIEELAGNEPEARKIYQQGAAEFKNDPKAQRLFRAGLDRLDSRADARPAGAGRRDHPPDTDRPTAAHALVMILTGLQGADEAPEEAGFKFWEAARAARTGQYGEAIKSLRQAKQLHDTRRFQNLLKAQNPTSDPDERIFLRCCDLLESYWQLQLEWKEKGYASPAAVLTALERDTAALRAVGDVLKEAKYDPKDAVSAVKSVLREKMEAEEKRKLAEEQVASLAESKKKADAARLALSDALKAAMIPEDEAAKALKGLVASQKQLEAINARLKSAQVKAADPVAGVNQLVATRDDLEGTVGKVADRLNVQRPRILKELDDVLTQAKKSDASGRIQTLQTENKRLTAALGTAKEESDQQRKAADAAQVEARRFKADSAALAKERQLVASLEAERDRLSRELRNKPLGRSVDTGLSQDPLLAESFYSAGLVRYRAGQYLAAERDFDEACQLSEQDARYFYYRGLSRLAQGKEELATLDFRLAARLEQQQRPDRKAVSASLERVQGPTRQLLNRYRP